MQIIIFFQKKFYVQIHNVKEKCSCAALSRFRGILIVLGVDEVGV